MIKLEQIHKLIEEAYGLENKSISDSTTPTVDVLFYPSSGGSVLVKVYKHGFDPLNFHNCATSIYECRKEFTDEQVEDFMAKAIADIREIRKLRESSEEELRKLKVESIREDFEAEMQKLSDKYMKEIQRYEK